MNAFVGNCPCPLSPTGYCKHGGNKRFNYGFMNGTASYCRKVKKWIYNNFKGRSIECPLANIKEIEKQLKESIGDKP